MLKNNLKPTEPDLLRQKAEELLNKRYSGKEASLPNLDSPKLFHELEVHQIELEMQNEELRLALNIAEQATKQYADLYEEIYDFSPAGYFTLNYDGTISRLNLSGARLLGQERGLLVKRNFRDFVAFDQKSVFQHFLQAVIEYNSKGTCELQLTISEKPSSYVYLEAVVSKNEQKCLVAAVDITDRVEAEEALKQSETRLRELNATKDKFFSLIAHDLKGPFNSMLGLSELLYKEYDQFEENEIKEFINQIHSSSTNSLKLLDNLLQWAKSQTGLLVVLCEQLDIANLVLETIGSLKPAAGKKNIVIHSSVPQGSVAIADCYMVRTILKNLLHNAIKFTNKGGEIEIKARVLKDELLISVADNGVGIQSADREKLFRVDQRFRILGTENEPGVGLGLILCKEFVEKNGGKIWIESEFGKGSKVHFTLPTI